MLACPAAGKKFHTEREVLLIKHMFLLLSSRYSEMKCKGEKDTYVLDLKADLHYLLKAFTQTFYRSEKCGNLTKFRPLFIFSLGKFTCESSGGI